MSDHDLTDFEKGPWSYDLYAGGLEPVGLLNDHADEAQGEWVSIEDYRKMEHERDMARATANTFRQCAEVTFGVMPFPRKFHWENAERIHGGAGAGKTRETPTPLDGASC